MIESDTEKTEYKNLIKFIEATNLGITFLAKHQQFVATFEKQYHIWSVVFQNKNSTIRETAVSPCNKLHEPSFIDLVYELCLNTKLYNNYISENMTSRPPHLSLNRGKRFSDLEINPEYVNKIVNFNHNQRWKLWQAHK